MGLFLLPIICTLAFRILCKMVGTEFSISLKKIYKSFIVLLLLLTSNLITHAQLNTKAFFGPITATIVMMYTFMKKERSWPITFQRLQKSKLLQ